MQPILVSYEAPFKKNSGRVGAIWSLLDHCFFLQKTCPESAKGGGAARGPRAGGGGHPEVTILT